jgi:uncharacterized protein YjbI with pentapeptide repeats
MSLDARARILAPLVAALCCIAQVTPLRADIFQWEYVDPLNPALGKRQSSALTPEGAGVVTENEAVLTGRDLTKAYLYKVQADRARFDSANLTDAYLAKSSLVEARFDSAVLTGADFSNASLTGVNFTHANLTGAKFHFNNLEGADFTDAIIVGAKLNGVTLGGFNLDTLYATASYKTGKLQSITLQNNSLPTADFSSADLSNLAYLFSNASNSNFREANLVGSRFQRVDLSDSDFTGADLTEANVDATLAGVRFDRANLTNAIFYNSYLPDVSFAGAIIRGARFHQASSLSESQLYSTASYQARDLRGTQLSRLLEGWSFRDQDLTGAVFDEATARNVDWSGANLTGASFMRADLQGENLAGLTIQGAQLDSANVQGVSFIGANLEQADLNGAKSSSANYSSSTLQKAGLSYANLSNADFTNADLRGAYLNDAVITGAVLVGADIRDAVLERAQGVTLAQLYSTASYQMGDLSGIKLRYLDLPGADLSGQNLTGAHFHSTNLEGASLADAKLYEAVFATDKISGTDFSNAELYRTSLPTMAPEQLYSTASYQQRTLLGVRFWYSDLTGWDLRDQDLTNSGFHSCTLAGVNFSGAVIRGVNLASATARGFTLEQLYSTASYQQRDLQEVNLDANSLEGADLSSQDLRRASFQNARMTSVNLTGSLIQGADIDPKPPYGFIAEQLYSTASYQDFDLRGVSFNSANLNGWKFSDQNLMGASFERAQLGAADFRRADLRGTIFEVPSRFSPTVMTNAIRPNGMIAGLNLANDERLVIRNFNLEYVAQSEYGNSKPSRPTRILVQQEASFSASSVLELRFDDAGWASTIAFAPRTAVQLGGVLRLEFADGVDPSNHFGRTFQVFDWTNVAPTGHFAIESPYQWDVSGLYTTGHITLIPEPASCVLVAGTPLALAASCRATRLKASGRA